MAPDFLLHPIFDEAEALTGVPNREVVYPTLQHRIDKAYDPLTGCERCRWNTSLSIRWSAVRFLSFGV